MDPIFLLGLAAGSLTTVSFVPQLLKVWRTKSADDLSMGMFATFSTGVVLWLAYGVAVGDLAIIIANSVTILLALAILILKMSYTGRS